MSNDNVTAPVGADGVSKIENKLYEVGAALLAMNRLATAHDVGIDGDTLSIAIEIMTKETLRSVDACIKTVGGAHFGCFSEEIVEEKASAC